MESPPPEPEMPLPLAASSKPATISLVTIISSLSWQVRALATSPAKGVVPFQSTLPIRLFAAFFRWCSSVGSRSQRCASAKMPVPMIFSSSSEKRTLPESLAKSDIAFAASAIQPLICWLKCLTSFHFCLISGTEIFLVASVVCFALGDVTGFDMDGGF